MIQAEDLMIGDWVLCPDHRSGNKTEVKVRNIYHDTDNDTIADWYGNIVDMEDIKPIPLTKDILVKNGFYFESNTGYVLNDYDGVIVIYDEWNHAVRILKKP